MYVHVPDPHPGRCMNHRFVNGQQVRCLDYEGIPHVCSFPEPPPVTSSAHIVYTKPTQPTRWVKPGWPGTTTPRLDGDITTKETP